MITHKDMLAVIESRIQTLETLQNNSQFFPRAQIGAINYTVSLLTEIHRKEIAKSWFWKRSDAYFLVDLLIKIKNYIEEFEKDLTRVQFSSEEEQCRLNYVLSDLRWLLSLPKII